VTIAELITKTAMEDRLSDSLETGYETDELLSYINDAINFVWHILIKNGYNEVINTINLTTASSTAPTDFYKSTNQAPVIKNGTTIVCYGTLPYTLKYYKLPTFPSATTDSCPFANEALNNIVAQLAIVLAMSNHGFDMQTETDFAQAICSLL
jgi:hypothetical protein